MSHCRRFRGRCTFGNTPRRHSRGPFALADTSDVGIDDRVPRILSSDPDHGA
jgi:hypothetical protein